MKADGTIVVLQGKTLLFEIRPIIRCAQAVAISGSPTDGTFGLHVHGIDVDGIAFNATAAEVQAVIEAVLGAGNVRVFGGPGPTYPWTVEFVGDLLGAAVATMTTFNVAFSGGTSPAVTVTPISAGGPLLVGGHWQASCQLRAAYADTASSILLAPTCTINASTGTIRAIATPEQTDAVVTEGGRYEVEVLNTSNGDVMRVIDGRWTLDKTVVRP